MADQPAGASKMAETDAGESRADLAMWRGLIIETDPAPDPWRPADMTKGPMQRCPMKEHGDEKECARGDNLVLKHRKSSCYESYGNFLDNEKQMVRDHDCEETVSTRRGRRPRPQR